MFIGSLTRLTQFYMNTYMSLQMCLKYIPKMTFQQQKITKGVNIVWFSGEYYVEFDSKHNF